MSWKEVIKVCRIIVKFIAKFDRHCIIYSVRHNRESVVLSDNSWGSMNLS